MEVSWKGRKLNPGEFRPRPVRPDVVNVKDFKQIPHAMRGAPMGGKQAIPSAAKKPRFESVKQAPAQKQPRPAKRFATVFTPKQSPSPVVIEKKAVLNIVTNVKKEIKPVPAKQNPVQPAPIKEPKAKPAPIDEKVVQPSKSEPQAPPAPSTDPDCELTVLLSKVLNNELKNIIIKVWQKLSDEAPTETEQTAIEKFRAHAGDDLRKAYGLNVTKRLWNLHNQLYVKLVFTGKPEPGCLQTFINGYNITAFKRIEKPLNTFAAQLRTIADFDRICNAKDVKCGSASITVTPCYKFLQSPQALKTVNESSEEIKTVSNTKVENKSPPIEKNKSPPIEKNKIVTMISENPKVNIENSPKIKEIPIKTPTESPKNSDAKEIPNNKVDTKADIKVEPSEPVKNDVKVKAVKKIETKNTVNSKICGDVTLVKKVATKRKSLSKVMVVDSQEGDEEEMTDQDILAFLSQGIVLDECSGSEDNY